MAEECLSFEVRFLQCQNNDIRLTFDLYNNFSRVFLKGLYLHTCTETGQPLQSWLGSLLRGLQVKF